MKSSGILCCVVAVVLEVSRDRSASSSLISSYDPWKRRQITLHKIPEEPESFYTYYYNGHLFVRPSAWSNSAPTGRNFMKFDI
jgi:hypothetical protein